MDKMEKGWRYDGRFNDLFAGDCSDVCAELGV